MSTFAVVERPTGRRKGKGKKWGSILDALVETADSGKAIAIPLNGCKNSNSVRANIASQFARRRLDGVSLHTQATDDDAGVIAWCSRK